MISNLIGIWDTEFGLKSLNQSFLWIRNLLAGGYIGHSYKAKIGLSAKNLQNGMVTDFKHLNFVKEFIDKFLDHKFMIDKNDPLFDALFPQFEDIQKFENSAIQDKEFFKFIDISKLKGKYDAIDLEHIESFVVVDFVPTSENICKFLYRIIKAKMSDFLWENDIELAFVELWETPKSHCIYTEN